MRHVRLITSLAAVLLSLCAMPVWAQRPAPLGPCIPDAQLFDASGYPKPDAAYGVLATVPVMDGFRLTIYVPKSPTARDSVAFLQWEVTPVDTKDIRGGHPGWRIPFCLGKLLANPLDTTHSTWTLYLRSVTPKTKAPTWYKGGTITLPYPW